MLRDSQIRPFNTPLECGLRLLFVLDAAGEMPADLQRLIAYDYLLVHSGDVEEGPQSLHPAVPFRGGEMLVKRDSLRVGLDQMFSKELLVKELTSSGITYRRSSLTGAFLALMGSEYAQALSWRARWVVERFATLSDGDLAMFMERNIGRWGAEFDNLSALSELVL